MSESKGDDVLTTEQVKAEYRISRSSLWRLGKQGILKPIEDSDLLTHPHENKYRREDIERAIQIVAERRSNRGRAPKAND